MTNGHLSCDSEFLFLDNSPFGDVDVLPKRFSTCWIGRTGTNNEAIQVSHCEKLKEGTPDDL